MICNNQNEVAQSFSKQNLDVALRGNASLHFQSIKGCVDFPGYDRILVSECERAINVDPKKLQRGIRKDCSATENHK